MKSGERKSYRVHQFVAALGGLFLLVGTVSCTSSSPVVKETCGDLTVMLQFTTPSTVRVVKYPSSDSPSLAPSKTVVQAPSKNVALKREKSGDFLTLSSDELTAKVDLRDGSVSFLTPEGLQLLREKPATTTFAPFKDAGKDSYSVGQVFCLDPDEAIYGLGSHRDGGLNQRGRTWHLENENMEICIPLVHSIKGWALYWDNFSSTDFEDGKDGMSLKSIVGDKEDYYFLYGKTPDGVVSKIRDLSGKAPLAPLWTFGYMQSKERYASAEELVGVLDRYREEQVPLDVVIQDWQYWGDNAHWNATEFLNPAFPDPAAMTRYIHSRGAHVLLSVWPSFGPQSDIFKELDAKGLLFDFETFPEGNGVRVYDPWDPEARRIYFEHLDRGLFSKGIDGWWLDATEPEHKKPTEDHFNAMTPEGSYRKMHNSFPLYSVGGFYDNFRQAHPDRRVLVLTRSSFLGLQRYGAYIWSGDIISSWDVLRYQVGSALNYTMTGLPYWNSDIGGFFPANNYPDGYKDPKYRELYVRWAQFGVLSAMMRSHGTQTPREIWRFGERGTKYYDAIEKAIRLRYSLIPYLYSQAGRITFEDASLMRPVLMDYPTDRNTWDLEDELLIGNDILGAPVLGEGGVRDIYLPAGEWTEWWSGEKVQGGKSFKRDVPLDILPMYVKAGSIIPMGPDVQYTSQKGWDDIQLRIYPGADGAFTLYEDKGDGYGYEEGECSRISFTWDDATSTLRIGSREGSFEGMADKRTFRVVLVRPGRGVGLERESVDRSVEYDGNETEVTLK